MKYLRILDVVNFMKEKWLELEFLFMAMIRKCRLAIIPRLFLELLRPPIPLITIAKDLLVAFVVGVFYLMQHSDGQGQELCICEAHYTKMPL